MQRASEIVSAQNSLLLPLYFFEGHILAFSSMKIITFRLNVPLSIFQRQTLLQKGNIIVGLIILQFLYARHNSQLKLQIMP